jgi:hypothetical protein
MNDEVVKFNAVVTTDDTVVPYTMIVSMTPTNFFYDRLGKLHQCVETEREFYLEWLKEKVK